MRLRDFQISDEAWPSVKQTLEVTTPRCIALQVVVFYFLRSLNPRIEAPFVKLLVEVKESSGPCGDEEGDVTECLGICTVTVVEPFAGLLGDERRAHSVLVEAVLRALGHVKREMHWESPELVTFVESLRGKYPPLEHCLDRLTKTERRSKHRCETWLQISPAGTTVEVRVSTNGAEALRHTVFQQSCPDIVDEFDARSAIIKDGHYTLRDRNKKELARVALS
ncbi:MAG TPA: hypothetical protein PKA88_34615 [Polyangiaceae bacterium]|nr:hypothetical protein [Polyangiaceae bacterium]HMR80191.1 hypothetical protein [Polyangiaceae bacterium]